MTQQQLNNIRFAVREVPAFVGHSFASDDRELIELLVEFLENLGLACDSGRRPEPSGISDKITKRIQSAEVFVGIFTRQNPKPDGTFTTSPWVIEEKATAIAAGKRLLLFVEQGVEKEIGGLQGDYEYVPFNRETLARALVHSMEYVNAVTTVPLTCRVDPAANRIELRFGDQNESIDAQIDELQRQKATQPENAQLVIALARLLEKKDRRSAIRELEDVIKRVPNIPDAHHELAHFLERDGRLDDALLGFQRALDLNPADYKNNRCYGRALYQKAMQSIEPNAKAATLEKAKRLLERAGIIGGEGARKQINDDLFLISEALKVAQPDHH